MTPGVLAAVAAVLLVAGVALLFNGLVRARQHVREGWAAIDVQLQRRASLVPNLVETVRGYADYERQTLQRIVEARGALGAATGPRDAAQANDDLSGAIRAVFALAEAYPDLKASDRFGQLQKDLADTETLIARARNYYNGAVEAYNNRVQTVPGVLVARLFGFPPAEFFAAEGAARAAVTVDGLG
ncbi:MAG: LemA family protein [Vicinamibacterales bacterium]